MARVDIKT